MKYSDLEFDDLTTVVTPARLLRLRDAIRYVGSEVILRELENSAGLKPYRKQNRLTVYDRVEIDKAIDLIRNC